MSDQQPDPDDFFGATFARMLGFHPSQTVGERLSQWLSVAAILAAIGGVGWLGFSAVQGAAEIAMFLWSGMVGNAVAGASGLADAAETIGLDSLLTLGGALG